jgi:hypothetical protein
VEWSKIGAIMDNYVVSKPLDKTEILFLGSEINNPKVLSEYARILRKRNIVLVVPAGNEGVEICSNCPECGEDMIIVTTIN